MCLPSLTAEQWRTTIDQWTGPRTSLSQAQLSSTFTSLQLHKHFKGLQFRRQLRAKCLNPLLEKAHWAVHMNKFLLLLFICFAEMLCCISALIGLTTVCSWEQQTTCLPIPSKYATCSKSTFLSGLVWISSICYASPQNRKRIKISGFGPTLCVQNRERKGACLLVITVFIWAQDLVSLHPPSQETSLRTARHLAAQPLWQPKPKGLTGN